MLTSAISLLLALLITETEAALNEKSLFDDSIYL